MIHSFFTAKKARKRLDIPEAVVNMVNAVNSQNDTDPLAEPLPTDVSTTTEQTPLNLTEGESLLLEIANLRQERDEAYVEIEKLRKKLDMCGMSSESVANDNVKTEMMTGISWPKFLQLYLFLSTFLSHRRDALPLKEQLFLTLVKLRQGVPFGFLAHVRGIPRQTTIDYFWKWIDLMHAKLGFMVKWPERDNLHTIIPPIFKEKFPRLTSIIDCFEIFIDAPSNLLARAQLYSHYKKHTTVKVLISCNPYGQINFLSPAWGGRVSDVQIVRESGFISSSYHLFAG